MLYFDTLMNLIAVYETRDFAQCCRDGEGVVKGW